MTFRGKWSAFSVREMHPASGPDSSPAVTIRADLTPPELAMDSSTSSLPSAFGRLCSKQDCTWGRTRESGPPSSRVVSVTGFSRRGGPATGGGAGVSTGGGATGVSTGGGGGGGVTRAMGCCGGAGGGFGPSSAARRSGCTASHP